MSTMTQLGASENNPLCPMAGALLLCYGHAVQVCGAGLEDSVVRGCDNSKRRQKQENTVLSIK